jgi:hypothetical protein
MNVLTAKEARDFALTNNTVVQQFFDWVKFRSEVFHDLEGYFYIPENTRDFTELELNFIKKQGYLIRWNRACQWYEVSWGDN